MTIGREKDDYYITPPDATRALLAVEGFQQVIWEPACGNGAISEVLKTAGYDVFSTDLRDRGYGEGGLDFLRGRPAPCDMDIVTNPPFKLAEEFALRAIESRAPKTALLLRLSWLEGLARYNRFFKYHRPNRVLVFSERMTLWHGLDPDARSSGGTMAYAWFIWQTTSGPAQQTTIDWLPAQRAHK